MILFGKGVAPKGEVSKEDQLYTNQIAPTVLETLSLTPGDSEMQGIPLPLD